MSLINIRKLIIVSISLIATLGFVVLWFFLLTKINYTGNIKICIESKINYKEFEVRALSVRAMPIIADRINNEFIIFNNNRPYSDIIILVPKQAINFQIYIHYREKDFSYTQRDLVYIKTFQDTKYYSIPKEVSKRTTLVNKNTGLIFVIVSNVFWSGLYKWFFALWIIMLISIILLYLFRKKIFKKYDKFQQKIKKTIIIFLVVFAILSLFVHQLIVSYGFILISTGPVYLICLYFALFIPLRFLLKRNIRLQKNVLLLLSSIFLMFFVIEIGLRISGITTTYTEKRSGYYQSPYTPTEPGWYHTWPISKIHFLKTSEYNFERQSNSLGLSDVEPIEKKDSNEYRIIGLGDSFTEGDGADTDSTWLKFLERNINKKHNKIFKFINAGICGSDPYFEYVLLRDKLVCYKPDLVILAINDEITDIIVRGGIERFKSDGMLQFIKPPKWEWVFSISHIFRLIVYNVMRYDQLLISSSQYNDRFEHALKQLKESLLLFKSLSEKEGFKLLVVMHPLRNEIDNKSFKYLSKVEQYAKKNKIETLNMLDYYINKENISINNSFEYYWKIDGHHNAKGYSAFDRGVELKLLEMGIIDSIKTQKYEE